jgi:hypothetical protein
MHIDELLPVPLWLNKANHSGIRNNQDQLKNHDFDGLNIDRY